MQERNLFDHNEQNTEIRTALVNSIKGMFPIESGGKQLNIMDIEIEDKLDNNDFPAQKEVKLNRKSWDIPIYAKFNISDTTTGKSLNSSRKLKIGSIPKLTNRFTTIIDGNEYQTVNQIRRRSGVYSRIKKNGELEAEFNLSKGKNFKMQLDPVSQVFHIMLANRKIRVWTLLNLLEYPDKEIEKFWGNALLNINKRNALNTEVSEMNYLYKQIYRKDPPKDFKQVIESLQTYFTSLTELDPDTTKLTLGKSFDKVTGETLLAASKKLLEINRGISKPDERDNLIYKKIYSVDDLLSNYFEKQSPIIKKKLVRNLGLRENVREVIGASVFGEPIKRFFTVGDLSSTPVQTNPVTIATEWRKTTPMGTGGIGSSHAINMETRDVQPTHLGFLDPLATPESQKVGISIGLASEVRKRGNEMVTPLLNTKGNLVWFTPTQLFSEKVGFPDQFKKDGKEIKPRYPFVTVMYRGQTIKVPGKEVKYYLRSPKSMFSFAQNLVPFIANTQGNRASTGARMITQAMPLDKAEPPNVRSYRDSQSTYEDLLGSFLITFPEEDGVVSSVDDNYIYVKSGKKTKKYGLYNNFPLNQDGFLHSNPLVSVGDKVTTKTPLFEHNYSDDKTLAIGKNLDVAYMSYKGYNFEDGAVITRSAADKLSHTMIHRKNIFFSPKLATFDKTKFSAWFPDVLTQENSKKLGTNGIIKVGAEVNPGDIVAAFLVERELKDTEKALKKLNRYTFNNFIKHTTEWDEEESGIVTDVRKVGRNIDIYIKSTHPLKEGDKIAGKFGNKSIITKIIPDSDAPQRADGTIIDVMMSPEGVPGRMNIGQLLETAAGKIAKKTGKPYVVNNFSTPGEDASKKVYDDLLKAGLTVDEVLKDGATGKLIKNPIFTGNQYIMKLRHIVKKKQGVHNTGVYDINEQPAGKGAQKVGILESFSYLGHGAKANLHEISNIKGRENENYWRDLQFGLPPTTPSRNFVFDKMVNYLKGTGVNVDKEGNKLQLSPLTDKQVSKLSKGALTNPGAMLIGKNLMSIKGGLFDAEITGGAKGRQWSHIELTTKIPNPMFEDAIIKVLGLTGLKFTNILNGKDDIDGKTGIKGIVEALGKINVDKELRKLKIELKTSPPTNVNKLNTRIKYLQNLKNLKLTPKEAYVMQKVPVLPPAFRPVYALPSGDLMVSDVNKHYRDIGLINKNLKAVYKDLTEQDKITSEAALFTSVKAMQGFIDPITYSKEKYKGLLENLGKQKTGLVQGKAWSKRQDVSGRSTITVDPTLGLDQVGIPKEMAHEMLKPFIIKELRQTGMKAAQALKHYEDKTSLALTALTQVLERQPIILNRAPSLHKHSIQAFKGQLVDGKSINLNPMIVKGFNADFDGDTMSMTVPIGREAIEEAKGMMPSKILFKHGDNSLVPNLSKDYVLGLFELSKLGKKTNKNYENISEVQTDKINPTDIFILAGKAMTLGQYLINKPLPEELKDYTREMDGKTIKKLLTTIATNYTTRFPEIINTWTELGAKFAYDVGHTISLKDFILDRSYRDDLIKNELPAIQKLKGDDRIQALNELTKKVQTAQEKFIKNKNNIDKMYRSGSFTKSDSIRQILSMPGVLLDIDGKPIDLPVLKSYGEGLDTPSYWNTMYSVRKGTVDKAVNTQESGALNKALLNVTRRVVVSTEDCNTTKGLHIDVDNRNVFDRTLTETIPGVGSRNQVVDANVVNNAKKKGLKELPVRSPLTCEAPEGVCRSCYGLMPDGQLPNIGENVGILDSAAITERATQLTLQTFHTGGSALGGGGITEGFPRLKQILNVPAKLTGKATLASEPGIIKEVTKNPIGGYNVTVGEKDYIIPAGRLPIVEKGQNVQSGDSLSDGIIKPQELSEFKTHLDAQKYMVNEASKVYGGDFYDKSFETMIRGISNNAEITEAPEDSGYLRGDKTTISEIEHINKKRKKQNLTPIQFKPYLKSIDTLNTASDDWLTRVSTNRAKAAITQGAAKGLTSNIHGIDPIPAYLYGEEFGKKFDPEKGVFY